MSYFIQRILISLFVLAVAIVWSQNTYAVITKNYATSNEALAGCEADKAAAIARQNAELGGGTGSFAIRDGFPCDANHNTGDKTYTCKTERYRISTGAYNWTKFCDENGNTSTIGYPEGRYHVYTTLSPACEAQVGDNVQGYWGSVHGTIEAPAKVCDGSCEYDYVPSTTTDCQNDPSDSQIWECASTYTHSGNECSVADQQGEAIDESPEYNCTNVDCSSDPDPGGGSGGSGSGDGLPGDDPTGDDPSGDGNPDTPDGAGDGSGDVDGDGDRDLDCNPQSNPDCGYTGSASGVGDCSTQPSCQGDPVQCALLYQQWANMCYDGGSFTNPSNCQVDLTCDGDVLKCEIIRQQRQQYCDLYVGDGTTDLDPTNNIDFDRDLKEEGEEFDLPTAFDMTGIGAGSCPADYVMATSLGSVTLSFATLCSMAPILEALIIISSLFSAAFIVIGSPGRGGSK